MAAMEKHTLSFAVYKDMKKAFEGCVEMEYSSRNKTDVVVETVRLVCSKFEKGEYDDPSGWFCEDSAEIEYDMAISRSLMFRDCYVNSGYNDRFTIAFSIDHLRFKIYSRGYWPRMIEWEGGDPNARVETRPTKLNQNPRERWPEDPWCV